MTASEILDEVDQIESRLLVLDKQCHSHGSTATKQSNALKKRQAELLAELRRLDRTVVEEGG